MIIKNNYQSYFLPHTISAPKITSDKAKSAAMIVKGKIRYCRPSTSRSSLADETLREESLEQSLRLGLRSRLINLLPPYRSFPEDPAMVVWSEKLSIFQVNLNLIWIFFQFNLPPIIDLRLQILQDYCISMQRTCRRFLLKFKL